MLHEDTTVRRDVSGRRSTQQLSVMRRPLDHEGPTVVLATIAASRILWIGNAYAIAKGAEVE
jgi:hypothetical protein